jgi:hypothetical protein
MFAAPVLSFFVTYYEFFVLAFTLMVVTYVPRCFPDPKKVPIPVDSSDDVKSGRKIHYEYVTPDLTKPDLTPAVGCYYPVHDTAPVFAYYPVLVAVPVYGCYPAHVTVPVYGYYSVPVFV